MNLDDVVALSNSDAEIKDSEETIKGNYLKAKVDFAMASKVLRDEIERKFTADIQSYFSNNTSIKLEDDGEIIKVKIGNGDIYIELKNLNDVNPLFLKKEIKVKRGDSYRLFSLVLKAVIPPDIGIVDSEDGVDHYFQKKGFVFNANALENVKKSTKKFNINTKNISKLNKFIYEIRDSSGVLTGQINRNNDFPTIMARVFQLSDLFN